MKCAVLPIFLALLAPLAASAQSEPIRTIVSVAPQKFLVERIGGSSVTVTALVGPGQDPHHFSLTPKQALAIGKAQIYFATGMPFEKAQLQRLSETNEGLQIVDLSARLELLTLDHDHDHDHDHDEHAHHEETDPHIWLSPQLLLRQAETVYDALLPHATTGEERDAMKENLDKLVGEIATTEEAIAKQLAPFAGRSFFVFHPAFGYFAQAYGLRQESIEVGGKKPTAAKIVKLIGEAKADGVQTLFVQPGFDHTAAEQIARGIGGEVAQLDPLAPDVLGNLRAISSALVAGFGANK